MAQIKDLRDKVDFKNETANKIRDFVLDRKFILVVAIICIIISVTMIVVFIGSSTEWWYLVGLAFGVAVISISSVGILWVGYEYYSDWKKNKKDKEMEEPGMHHMKNHKNHKKKSMSDSDSSLIIY